MSESVDAWAEEILDYLLGRLSKARIDVPRNPQTAKLTHPPIRRWWTFEGKRYASLGGSLSANWAAVISGAWRLEQTFNPRLRVSDRPDGIVDWPRTIARGPRHKFSEFVVRSSGIGLDEDERAALWGWAAWISDEWFEYTGAYGNTAERLEWRGPQIEPHHSVGIERLRRWAHIARRSRWVLLRDVVAESLRPVLEADELDRIPLPAERADLFELLCLVRIARELAPFPTELSWLLPETTGNTVRLEGVRCKYQEAITREDVLATPEYSGSLANSIRIFNVGAALRMDLAFDFDAPRAGFHGIIVEAKSGKEQYGATVLQLRAYRAARRRRSQSRFLIWGIVESPEGPATTAEQVMRALEGAGTADDVWIFSSANAIPNVLHALFSEAQKSAPLLAPAEAQQHEQILVGAATNTT